MCKGTYRFNKPLSVESIAYSHGLFCASHPKGVIAVVALVVILCSLPFFVTTSGDLNSPKTWKTQWLNYRTPVTTGAEGSQWIVNDAAQFSARAPSWFVDLPLAVIQQVYVKLELDCNEKNTELCRKSQFSKTRIAASHLTNRMEDIIEICRPVFHPAALNLSHNIRQPPTPHLYPSHNGVLSPSLDTLSNQWDKSDNSSLGYHSFKELLYGGFWELEHQLSRRVGVIDKHDQQHVFGLTFVLQPSRDGFNNLTKCLDALKSKWPNVDKDIQEIIQHFYFEPKWRLIDFSPLIVLYSIVFLYISFSVGKINLVKSKVGLGFTACLTVVASLTMSLGICTFFGVSISLSGSEIYPYVVITIGLENILIIVKAVISTPEELEVKYRIAVGLSKEGWAILQNLLTLLCMMTLSLLVFNYKMREFCVIALVGVLCDSFLQLIFFTTVLSVDLRRLELSDLRSQPLPDPSSIPDSPGSKGSNPCPPSITLVTSKELRSKRVKFFYFLARARPVSRVLMVAFSVVLLAWFSNTETFHNIVTDLLSTSPATNPTLVPPLGLDTPTVDDTLLQQKWSQGELDQEKGFSLPTVPTDSSLLGDSVEKSQSGLKSSLFDAIIPLNESDVFVSRVRSEDMSGVAGMWRNMVTTHWPRLLDYAGFGINGRFLTLLPPISLSLHIGFSTPPSPSLTPTPTLAHFIFHVYTLRAVFLVVLMISAVVYVGFLVSSANLRHKQSLNTVHVRKHTGRVVCLKGHKQDIDCVCVERDILVSASLDGDIRVWNTNPGSKRCLRTIHRSELCGEPPPNSVTTNISNRPVADGCEDESDNAPSTTPVLRTKAKVKTFSPSVSSPLPSQASQLSQVPNFSYSAHIPPCSPIPQVSQSSLPPNPMSKKSPSTHSLPSLSHLPYPHSPPPHSPQSTGFFNAIPTTPVPLHYISQGNTLQSGVSKTLNSHNPSAVHLVTATRVTPTPQQTCVPSPIPPQTPNSSGYYQHTNAQTQYSTTPTQYSTVRAQHTTPQAQYTAIPQPHQYTSAANQSSNPQQSGYSQSRTFTPGSYKPRTHNRALSHGQLNFHKPTTTSHGRASASHISLQVSPSEDNFPPYVSPSVPHKAPETLTESPRDESSVNRQGYGVRRHSLQRSLCVQRAHSVGSRSDLTSTAQVVDTPSTYTHVSPCTPSSATPNSSNYSSDRSVQANTQYSQPPPSVNIRSHSARSNYPASSVVGATRDTTCPSNPTSGVSSSNIEVPLHPPVISTPRITPTRSDSSYPPVCTSAVSSSSAPSTAVITSNAKQAEVTRASCSKQSHDKPINQSLSFDSNKGPHLRRHVRNHSLGNDLPHRRSMGHARNRSLGSIVGSFQPRTLSSRQTSIGNLSLASVNSFLPDSPFLALPQTPNSETGYDFAAHFNLFSQYTANMAIQYFSVPERNLEPEPSVPPVWCMGVWNKIIAVGCGNGQVEAWNADTGSLVFCINLSPVGVATIGISPQGIFTGHMDGVINLVGHNGILKKSVHIHSEPISVLRCHGDRVIAGSYDSIVSVFRSMDLVQVTSQHGHYGRIRDIVCVDGLTRGCVSGCSKGLVLHWDVDTGEYIHDYGMYEGGVVKLGWSGLSTIALFTDCFRVWDCVNGTLVHTVSMDGLCNNFTVMGSRHIAASFESHVVVYDIDSGAKHWEQYLQSDRTVTLINHILTLDEANVVCTSGKDVHIVPCQVKLKMD